MGFLDFLPLNLKIEIFALLFVSKWEVQWFFSLVKIVIS